MKEMSEENTGLQGHEGSLQHFTNDLNLKPYYHSNAMKQPTLTAAEAKNFVRLSGSSIIEPVYILAIRGYYKNIGKPAENDRGIYDDALFLIGPDLFLAVNANTDPSRYKPGMAKLVPGLHYYKKGLHHLSDPDPRRRYAAFRPDTADESLPVTRDGQQGISKGYAINIHKGGYSSTSSEGCQTVYPEQWLQFQQMAYRAMDEYGQRRIGYLLAEGF